jgi:hypothetical protein
MALVGALALLPATPLTVSPLLGGTTGAAVIQALFPCTLNVGTLLLPDTGVTRRPFIEMFITAMLMLTMYVRFLLYLFEDIP